ncbi:menaquinone biosynthetic enzyme MqnA/MqnD family protein [Phycisphaera mikurensis]|uniref:Chorismate dehydratase n=1 Tax=Phycisphaera mikurensis (strain NBRC 102666 / KCTC 22515 / FYK2301M01) TaxID=1142394 RepID=I0IE21_PHYMF|nr:MqnA/MqnD/SBP family protein [Phycisphaera mikurensis]MBB6441316.1 chorismate dehydratase [Phycisphaera mikurensis]BAM03509.1 hypothetical protein PSMK_13500 [Phycisphaera mikurensis NBRC 102666]
MAVDRPTTLGCVSYLNAKPLIDGLACDGLRVELGVPSSLLAGLVDGRFDAALCPVIDLFRSPVPLRLLPVGGIGCRGDTLTVRLFSRVPLEDLRGVAVDRDSHTSVGLLRVLLHRRLGRVPALEPEEMRDADLAEAVPGGHEAALLIGDKVVTHEPPAELYPHQLDLGGAWARAFGLPFLFAGWLTPRAALPSRLERRMEAVRARNLARVPELVRRHAAGLGWPAGLAEAYLGRILCYETGPEQLAAVRRFGAELGRLGLIENAERDLLGLPAAAVTP